MKNTLTTTKKHCFALWSQHRFNLAEMLLRVSQRLVEQQPSLRKMTKTSGLMLLCIICPVEKTCALIDNSTLNDNRTINEDTNMDATRDQNSQTPSQKPLLVTYPGEITGNTPHWEYLESEAGKVVHVPFEGRYESKGGRIQSPWIDLDKAPGQPAYYQLKFTAKTSESCYWWVDFLDVNGQPLPDINSAVYVGNEEEAYDQMIYVMGAASRLRLAFRSAAGILVRDITVQWVSETEAALWGDRLYATLPPLAFEPPSDAFALLPRTAAAIKSDKPWRVVMLGDSIQNDSFNSVFQALVKRDFPQSNLDFVVSVRGSTGCWFYQDPENFREYVTQHQPDLLLIGGISNDQLSRGSSEENFAAIGSVISQAKALGCEVALLSPPHSVDWRPFDAENPEADLPAKVWSEETLDPKGVRQLRWTPYRDLAREADIAFWNLTIPTADSLAASCKPHDWFNRDYVHNNDRGKQMIGRTLQRYFLTAAQGSHSKTERTKP